MKKLVAFIFVLLAVFFMNAPFAGTAEAARVAVVPIQINDGLVERSADFNGYYWDIMIEKFKYPDYELMDDEKVSAVIPDEGLASYDQATLMSLCEKVDVASCKDSDPKISMLEACATVMKGNGSFEYLFHEWNKYIDERRMEYHKHHY